jgi:hypothetical protein
MTKKMKMMMKVRMKAHLPKKPHQGKLKTQMRKKKTMTVMKKLEDKRSKRKLMKMPIKSKRCMPNMKLLWLS